MQDESASPATSNVGTPMYMAPELILNVPLYDGKVQSPPGQSLASGALTRTSFLSYPTGYWQNLLISHIFDKQSWA